MEIVGSSIVQVLRIITVIDTRLGMVPYPSLLPRMKPNLSSQISRARFGDRTLRYYGYVLPQLFYILAEQLRCGL